VDVPAYCVHALVPRTGTIAKKLGSATISHKFQQEMLTYRKYFLAIDKQLMLW
jgi:hypothetical protein